MFSLGGLRTRTGRSPSLGVRGTREGPARGLRAPEVLAFVTTFFPVSSLFAILAKTRSPLDLFRGHRLLQLKAETFGILSPG